MLILRIHNRYQSRGGEDVSFEREAGLLADAGHVVERLEFTNDAILPRQSATDLLRLAGTTIWSRQARERIADAVETIRPDIAHFDNTFPLVSPGAYSGCAARGVAVVQTLHNYRLLCPSATFYRDGHACEDCLGKTPPLPGVAHGCYRHSRAQTAVVASMLTVHRLRRTWTRDVDRYIALTDFARSKFIEGGLPAARIAVKPNFVDSAAPFARSRDGAFLFVGRLAPEKGIATLLRAASVLPSDVPIRIAGDGPLAEVVEEVTSTEPALSALGRLDHVRVSEEMQGARALIFPSEWYEGYPLTIVEAFACATPVIASRLGAMVEIVEDGVTGLLFEPGNADDLAAKVRWAADHPDEMRRMGENARREYEAKYTPERNYELLMDIYRQAIDHARRRGL